MLRDVKSLYGYKIKAKDGAIGEVYDFFFDDESWTVRYLVVDIETWLLDRKVLISPDALRQPEWESKEFPVNLTIQQVKNSPDIDVEKPVSRQRQIDLHNYYGWPLYWHAVGPYNIPPNPHISELAMEQSVRQEKPTSSHLRSMREVNTYYIHAIDGKIGHVADFIIDDETWVIRYLVVDTKIWLPGKHVLISPQWIDAVHWEESEVYVDLSREEIKNSPEYNPSHPINLEYEIRLYDYYGRPKYWDFS